jgi:hypothetical protein
MNLTSYCSVFQRSLGLRSFKTIFYATYIYGDFHSRFISCGIWRYAARWKSADILEGSLRSKNNPSQLLTYLAYSLTLYIEATCASETSVDFHCITWHYTPEDRTVHNVHKDSGENLRSYVLIQILFSLRVFFCGRVPILSCLHYFDLPVTRTAWVKIFKRREIAMSQTGWCSYRADRKCGVRRRMHGGTKVDWRTDGGGRLLLLQFGTDVRANWN